MGHCLRMGDEEREVFTLLTDIGSLKALVEAYTGLEKDALHIHVALLIYILTSLLIVRGGKGQLPWFVVLAVELFNEFLDFRRHDPINGIYPWEESAKDLWNTMLWPSILVILARNTALLDQSKKSEPTCACPPLLRGNQEQEVRR